MIILALLTQQYMCRGQFRTLLPDKILAYGIFLFAVSSVAYGLKKKSLDCQGLNLFHCKNEEGNV